MASKYSGVRTSTPNETHELLLIPRLNNSAYEMDKTKQISFRGKIAGTLEKKAYRLLTGVNTSTDSIFIMSSSLPDEIKDGDMCYFLGKKWTVESVGYYYDQTLIINASLFDPEYIIAKCPKGITLA